MHREDGFALPLALFFMALLTMMITAAFSKVAGDRRAADSSGAAVTALAVAESGLQTYIGTATSRPADGDSTRINVTGGYADVVVRIAQRPADTMASELFIVRSTGHVIDPTQGSDPQASRTIAQFAQWQVGHITYAAAFTAANGVANWTLASDGVDSIQGADSTGCSSPLITTGGLRVGQSDPSPSNAPYTTGSPAFLDANNPPAGSTIGVDWAAIDSGGFKTDYSTLTNLNSWSTYFINGPATLTSSGNGLLMVRDSLILSGATVDWAGIILVGRHIVFNATNTRISGLVASGLRNEFSSYGTHSRLGGAGTTLMITFNSCNIRRALESLNGLAPIPNARVDNWKTY